MRKTSVVFVALLASFVLVGSQVASAVSTNPVKPTPAQVQALFDATAGDSGNTQLSTVNSISDTDRGIKVDATFRVGVGTGDPFDPNFGQNFARITLKTFPFPHLDWSAFDGLKLTLTHSLGSSNGSFIQPFVQTGGSFLFHEPSGGGIGLGSSSPTDIVFDFSNARIFSPFTDPIAVANTNDVGGWGIQIITNGLTVGNSLDATICIESIPEPATLSMVGLCAVVLGMRRRR
ncbi:MAG: PEP-CTERM sorting domain-containing protein [Bythopirellula sp.]|nr:PEP-CTERM sorting domain-containing protein [Bythopirellula sp.]